MYLTTKRKMMTFSQKAKGFLSAAFLGAAAVTLTATPAQAAPSRPSGTMVINNDTGEISINEQRCRHRNRTADGECRIYLASVTKLMTAAIVSREIQNGNISLDDMVRTTPRAANQGRDAIELGLKVGERIRLYDALEVMAKYSANDVAVAIAGHVGGSERQFVRMMNDYARELGLTNTHFGNASGMPTDTYGGPSRSTLSDMAKLVQVLSQDELILRHFDNRNTVYNHINYRPDSVICTNRLDPVLVKTGWSKISGSNMAYVHQATNGQNYTILLFGYEGRVQRNERLVSIVNNLSPDQYTTRQAAGIHWRNCSPYRGRV